MIYFYISPLAFSLRTLIRSIVVFRCIPNLANVPYNWLLLTRITHCITEHSKITRHQATAGEVCLW